MKRFVKIVSVLLLLSMAAVMLVACGTPKGEVIAAYDGKPVFEGDVQSLINYRVVSEASLDATDEEKLEIAKDAVRTYVKYKVLELDLREKGYKVDEKALNESLKDTIKDLNETYEGGYSDWRNMYHVDKNFLKEELRRFAVAALFYDYILEGMELTDEVLRAYYSANGEKYMDPAGYTWTAVLREVVDMNDEAELAKAKSEMEEYIRQINGGFTTAEAVKADILKKYPKKDGYSLTEIYSGVNRTTFSEYTKVENLSEALAKIKETYGELNPKADPKTDEEAYNKYMKYMGDCYKTEVFYGLGTTEVGKAYANPIKSFAGYMIICLDKVKEKNGFLKFEDVKDSIIDEIQTKYAEEQLEGHINASLERHNAQFLFDDPAV